MDLYSPTPQYNNDYLSYISFIKTKDGIDKRLEAYIKFTEPYKKLTGVYSIPIDFFSHDYREKYIKNNSDLIESISPAIRYIRYVKIIQDLNNPEFNDRIMIFRHGYKIQQMINENPDKLYNNIFCIKIKLTGPYPNFDDSHFLSDENQIVDYNLTTKDKLVKPTFNLLGIRRSLKIKKLMTH